MNQNADLEHQLETIGAALRSRPRLTNRVMNEVRLCSDNDLIKDETLASPAPRRRRQLFTAAAGALATISAVLFVAILLFPSPSVSWADVTNALHAKKWIRATLTAGGGTMWLSPELELWAFKLDDSSYFYDGRKQVKYELVSGNVITKLPLGEEDAQKVLSMNALSQDKSAIGHWLFGTEKVVSQERREVTDGGRIWIEFQMTLWRGDMNQATLRVDPKTKLPVYLAVTSPKSPKESLKWEFDYPADGPTDIYALGVPRDTKIDDRMPSDEALAVLRAMATNRGKIGDFRLLVGQYPGSYRVRCVVWRKGDRWRVASYSKQGAEDSPAEPPDNENWAKWFEDQLKNYEPNPIYVCDGKTVWENSNSPPAQPEWKVSSHTAPQDLMSGDGHGNLQECPNVKIASLLFPALSPRAGWGFEFDPKPADAPGCVLLKRSAHTTSGMIGNEWYYVDPSKGHAVVRVVLFNLPLDAHGGPESSKRRTTIHMDGFQQTKEGFSYPAVVHNIEHDHEAVPQVKTTTRYHFDFAAELPESLFTVDDAQN